MKPPTPLVDGMLSAYVDWRGACRTLDAAYEAWGSGTGAHAALAFSRYSAALDQEESAAALYAELTRQVRRLSPAAA
jgi:hypothetical protein